nr:vegetative cell wall protein gp1 isoform X4 [Taeniopygia guttata]
MSKPRAGSDSSDCPDPLQDVQHLTSPTTPLIAASLRLGAAAEPSPGPGVLSGLQPGPARPSTCTPLPFPSHGRVPESRAGDCDVAAAPGPAPEELGCLPRPAAAPAPAPLCPGRFGAAPDGPPAAAPAPVPAARTAAAPGSLCPAHGPGWRCSSPRPAQGAVPGNRGSSGPQVNLHVQYPGTRLKPTSPARSRLQFASGALKQAQPSGNPKLASQDREMKTAAKVGSHKQPSSRLSTGIPIMASRSSLQPSEKVIPSKRFCLNKDINDQTWVCAKSSLSSELAPGLTSWCEDTVPAEQSAGDQLSKELERVKQELEQVKGELAEKTAQCKTYQQTISSLEAQLRAAGIHLKDAAVFNGGDLGRDLTAGTWGQTTAIVQMCEPLGY